MVVVERAAYYIAYPSYSEYLKGSKQYYCALTPTDLLESGPAHGASPQRQ